MPVYLVQGRHDLNNWAPTVERYYQVLKAPLKRLVSFERAGHNACYEDAVAFNRLLIETVRQGRREGETDIAS